MNAPVQCRLANEFCGQTLAYRFLIRSQHCTVTFFLKVPQSAQTYISFSYTFWDSGHTHFHAKKNKMLALGICFSQPFWSTVCRCAGWRLRSDYYQPWTIGSVVQEQIQWTWCHGNWIPLRLGICVRSRNTRPYLQPTIRIVEGHKKRIRILEPNTTSKLNGFVCIYRHNDAWIDVTLWFANLENLQLLNLNSGMTWALMATIYGSFAYVNTPNKRDCTVTAHTSTVRTKNRGCRISTSTTMPGPSVLK